VARSISVIAHRGAHEREAQNSLAAYQEAIRLGCDYIEVDLRTRADGALLIKHDPLKDGDQLPTFDEVLTLAKGRIGIYLDVKQAMPASIVGAVERHGMREQILTYGTPALLKDLVTLRPGWPCLPEAVSAAAVRTSLETLRPSVFAFSDWDFKPETIAAVRQAGRGLFLDRQGKTDHPEAWLAAIEAGATGLQTDRPTALVAWLREQGWHA